MHDLNFQEWSDVDGWCGQRRPPVQVDVRQVDPGRILGPKQRHYYAMANGYLPKLSSQNFSAKFRYFLSHRLTLTTASLLPKHCLPIPPGAA